MSEGVGNLKFGSRVGIHHERLACNCAIFHKLEWRFNLGTDSYSLNRFHIMKILSIALRCAALQGYSELQIR